jgi:DNA polymerase III delta prime subunit
MKVLKTRPAADVDREQRRVFQVSAFQEHLRSLHLGFSQETLEDLGVALRRPGLLLLSGEPGCGKSTLALELARYLCRDYSEAGYQRVVVRPDWKTPKPLIGGLGEDGVRYRVPPFLEIWLRALRHKELPHVVILEALDRADPEAFLGEILAARAREASLVLHADHLRCVPRAGLSQDLSNFFICHQDCAECFFVVEGYPRGVTGAVKDFVPARAQFPPNLLVLGILGKDPLRLPGSLRDRACLVEVIPCGMEELASLGALPNLTRIPEGLAILRRLEGKLREHGRLLSPRLWCEVDGLVGRGVGLRRALTLRARASLLDLSRSDMESLWEGVPEGKLLQDPEMVLGSGPHEGGEQGHSSHQQKDRAEDPVVDVEIWSKDLLQASSQVCCHGHKGVGLVENTQGQDDQNETQQGVQDDSHDVVSIAEEV